MEKNVIVDVVLLVFFFLVLFLVVIKKKLSIYFIFWNRYFFWLCVELGGVEEGRNWKERWIYIVYEENKNFILKVLKRLGCNVERN